MGDKKLKAISVYGTKDISIANPSRLVELCEHILTRTGPRRSNIEELWIESMPWFLGRAPFGNYRGSISPELQQKVDNAAEIARDFIKGNIRWVACYNCGLRCKHTYPVPGGDYAFVKCQSKATPMVGAGIIDLGFNMAFYNRCEKYGLDTNSFSNIINLAIDLYQRGILTKEDTGGMHLEYGNPEVAFSLAEKIARREGIGDILANGVYEAGRQIGKGAEKYVVHVKKLDQLPIHLTNPLYVLIAAINDKADRTRGDDGTSAHIWQCSREEREKYIKEGWFPHPKEFEKYFLADFDYSASDYEGIVQFVAHDEETYTLADSAGPCCFWLIFAHHPPLCGRPLMADLISSATGMDIDETEATKITRRIINLVRSYNVRAGLRRKDDAPQEMYFERTPEPPYQILGRDQLNKIIDRFYELRGWNSEGIPTKEALEESGLQDVRQELERRGF